MVEKLKATHPDFEVIVHTKTPDDFVFKGLPVYGPAQLSTLIRMDALRKYGGWYFDLDVQVRCNLKKLERMLNIGKNFTVSLTPTGVCTFASCCPENWEKWDDVVEFMLQNPKSAPGHYCTTALGKLLKLKPILCDYLPSEYIYSKSWISHKGILH
jgi:hypothetical protein